MEANTFKYAIVQHEAGSWFFSLNEDLSDLSEPYPTRQAAEDAVAELLAASLADAVAETLFGASA